MKSIPIHAAALVSIALTLQGCQTTYGSYSAASNKAIQAVVVGLQKSCQFVPTLTSIADILSLPGAGTTNQIVETICKAVQAKKAADAAKAEKSKETSLKSVELLSERAGSSAKIKQTFPAGVPITVDAYGISVSGLTTSK